MRINPTHQQLACFLRISKTRSFSDAARQLGISQPALSRTIRLMEDTLGTRLFDRNTRHVMLTPTGCELQPLAERMMADFANTFDELAKFVEGHGGRITVAALPSIAAILLPMAISTFHADHPDVEFIIRDGLSSSILEAVTDGRTEIGLTVQPMPTSKLIYEPLISDEFGLVCRADDPLGKKKNHAWSVFKDRRFIAMASSSGVRAATDAAFLQAGFAVSPLYECSFLGTAGHLIAAGLGITALPRLTLPLTAVPSLVWRPLSAPALRRQIGFVRRSGRSLSPATISFLGVLRREAAKLETGIGTRLQP